MAVRVPRTSSYRYGALALAVLAGCSSPPTRPSADLAQVRQFAGRGYLSEEQFSIRTTPVRWMVAGQSLDLLLSVPVRPGKYPLVVYLPGLGENRSAGEVWRNAWSQAGYAVLSVQPLGTDSQVWQSREARNGDFKPLVRERYSAAVMDARQSALRGLMEELRRRGSQGDPAVTSVDLDRVALAGYDLGAYTALVAVGEHIRTTAAPRARGDAPFRAVIALSPHADFNGPAFEGRYADIAVPVLSVTGDGDADAYGLGISASLRSAPFQYMPPRDKYLLMLDSAAHEFFAGNANSPEGVERGERGSRESRESGRDGERGRRARMGMGGSGGMGEPGGETEAGRMGEGQETSGRMGGTARAMGQSAISSVTTAFLDTYLKGDAISREWLVRDARRWLRNTGTLTVK